MFALSLPAIFADKGIHLCRFPCYFQYITTAIFTSVGKTRVFAFLPSAKDSCKHFPLYVVCQGWIKFDLTLNITKKIIEILHALHVLFFFSKSCLLGDIVVNSNTSQRAKWRHHGQPLNSVELPFSPQDTSWSQCYMWLTNIAIKTGISVSTLLWNTRKAYNFSFQT